MLGHKRGDAADAAADVDADALCVERSGDAAVSHGLAGRRHRKMGIDIAVQDVQLFHVLLGVKVAHLGGELDGIVRGVEFCDRADAARAGAKGVPERGDVVANGADDAQTSDCYSFHIIPPASSSSAAMRACCSGCLRFMLMGTQRCASMKQCSLVPVARSLPDAFRTS